MKVIDDKCKKVSWYNRNYFFAGTILVILINIILFWQLGNSWENNFEVSKGGKIACDFANLLRLFMNALSHSDWEHVLFNMLGVLVCGLYLERKIGSINMFLLLFVLIPLANWTAGANRMTVNSHGFSCVLYALYAFVILDYVFSFQKHKRNVLSTVLGALVITYIVVSMFWDDTKSFPITTIPEDLIYHKGHFSGFVIGLIFGLTMQLADIYIRKRTIKEIEAEQPKEYMASNIASKPAAPRQAAFSPKVIDKHIGAPQSQTNLPKTDASKVDKG